MPKEATKSRDGVALAGARLALQPRTRLASGQWILAPRQDPRPRITIPYDIRFEDQHRVVVDSEVMPFRTLRSMQTAHVEIAFPGSFGGATASPRAVGSHPWRAIEGGLTANPEADSYNAGLVFRETIPTGDIECDQAHVVLK
jgi:hypothetical protein